MPNILSAFEGCGICSLNRKKVLNKLQDKSGEPLSTIEDEDGLNHALN